MIDIYFYSKEYAKGFLGLSDAIIHINVGLALFLIFSLLLRHNRLAAPVAWIAVFILQIGNEVFDAWINAALPGWYLAIEASKDIVATLFWPTILVLIWPLLRDNREASLSS